VTANEMVVDVERRAYEIAWYEFSSLRGLTPDEKISGPNKLRWFIGCGGNRPLRREPNKSLKCCPGVHLGETIR
jgi:hypothetical protein